MQSVQCCPHATPSCTVKYAPSREQALGAVRKRIALPAFVGFEDHPRVAHGLDKPNVRICNQRQHQHQHQHQQGTRRWRMSIVTQRLFCGCTQRNHVIQPAISVRSALATPITDGRYDSAAPAGSAATPAGMASVAVIASTVVHHPHGAVIAVSWSASRLPASSAVAVARVWLSRHTVERLQHCFATPRFSPVKIARQARLPAHA